ncbi:MAG: 1-acyl-sn-glycerol-3-phosphate acyltransferase [Actinomycetota bacterium]
MSEPLSARWRRRAMSIPTMLGFTVLLVVGLPLLLPAAVVVDLVRGRLRMPTARVYLFVLQYVVNDSLEIVLAPVFWALAGFGTTLRSPASRARHLRLQNWSVRTMVNRADQLLDLPVEVDGADRLARGSGPVIAIGRHASLFDASLPGLVMEQLGWHVRGVIMAELLADPGFDLIYRRTGSVFIPRDDGPAAVRAIESMAAGADADTALVIFPEGRLYRRPVRDRLLARLADSDPERAARLADLRHLLPPRPGGFNALLDAVPDADVVLFDHRGLDNLRRLGDLLRVVPVGEAVTVTLRRFDRSGIPEDRPSRTAWLDQVWLDMDAAREADLREEGFKR